MIPWQIVGALGCAWLLAVLYAATRRRLLGRLATGLLAITWLAILLLLVARGLASGHWPLGTRHEFMLAYLWIILLSYLLLEVVWHERRAAPWVLPFTLLLAVPLALASPAEAAVTPLPAALRSPLLQVHVLLILIADGLLTVAGGLALTQLVRTAPGDGCPWLPPESETQARMMRLVALAVPWLAAGILSGAVWARDAWGSYWSWDPKETWALITFLWYQIPLHIASRPQCRKRALAWLLLIGLGLVLFTLIGVPQLAGALAIDTLHGY